MTPSLIVTNLDSAVYNYLLINKSHFQKNREIHLLMIYIEDDLSVCITNWK